MIHKNAEVQTSKIGENTIVWQNAIILGGATIGNNCNINCHTFIENDVILGDNVSIKSGVYLWDGITLHNNVFIGPNVTFTNDKFPRSKKHPPFFQRTVVEEFSSIGAGSIILGGVLIGKFSLIGAGSVVTKNVPPFALVLGNPARIVGWLNEDGTKMELIDDVYYDNQGQKWIVKNNELITFDENTIS